MVPRRAAAVLALSAAVAGCGRPTATAHRATPSATVAADVAVPTCTGAEVRPEFWTSACGDAGYQLRDLAYDSWTATSATARATAAITHGPDEGFLRDARVVFDRPVPFAAYGGRVAYSRAVVTYVGGPGPGGEATETFDLLELNS